MSTLFDAAKALVVRKPRPGGQSIMIAEKSTGSFSIACLKIYSFPSLLLISYSAFARETLEGTTPKPLTSVGFIASASSTLLVKTSYAPGWRLFDCMANPVLAFP